MDLEITGKVFAITGGTDGLGLALAERLVAEGAAVAICGRNEERLAAAVSQLSREGDVLGQQADVSRPADVTDFVAAVEELGHADSSESLKIMISGKRLKDISDLPLDLAV